MVTKFIRDPVHDLIRIDDEKILQLLDTFAMQRLRMIRQLGTAFFVYPGAEHSRFAHSLGVYHLTTRLLHQLNITNETDKQTVQIAALLHDCGHGPFSHLFERVTGQKHESWTSRIINENVEIRTILDSIDLNLASKISSMLTKTEYRNHLVEIFASQLDADRFDYMLRDSHMTGAKYGRLDLEWMIRTLSLEERTIVDEDGNSLTENGQEIKKIRMVLDVKRGLNGLEQFLSGNLYLYQNVYFHKTVLSSEGMIEMILKRALKLIEDDRHFSAPDPLKKIGRKEEITCKDYLSLNDFTLWGQFQIWSESEDNVLSDLCKRLLTRKLFKSLEVTPVPDKLEKAKQILSAKGLQPDYYLLQVDTERHAFKKARAEDIHLTNGPVRRFSELSTRDEYPISKAIIASLKTRKTVIAVAHEVYNDIKNIGW